MFEEVKEKVAVQEKDKEEDEEQETSESITIERSYAINSWRESRSVQGTGVRYFNYGRADKRVWIPGLAGVYLKMMIDQRTRKNHVII